MVEMDRAGSLRSLGLLDLSVDCNWSKDQSRRVLLFLSALTTAGGCWAFISLAGLLDNDDLEDDAEDEILQAVVVGARVWFLFSAIAGVIAAKGAMQNHLPSLRLFAIHSIIDTSFAALATLVIASVTFSPSVSTKLGHAVCEHLSRGDALGIVYSPGSGLEACEEKWSYGIAPVLLLLAAIALFFRSKTAHYIYNYYRRAAFDGRISLESPSIVTPTLHHPTYSSIPMKGRSNTTSSTSSTSSSLSSGRHSRSSSASTVRPGTASRIMLLPIDFKTSSSPSQKAAFPILQVTPPTPSSLVPSSSLSECPDTPKLSSTHNPPEKTRTGSRSNHGNVIVYAPILMSVEEAHQLGGREAVIATALSSSPNSGRVGSVGTRHRQHSPPSNRRTPTPPANISEDNNQPATPFAAIKGFRDSTEMEEMSNHRNKLL